MKIRIVRTELITDEGKKPYTVYHIEANYVGSSWNDSTLCSKHRYSEFVEFHEQLKRAHPTLKLPNLPSKTLLSSSNSKERVEKRKQQLEVYLSELIKLPQIIQDPFVRCFLNGSVQVSAIPLNSNSKSSAPNTTLVTNGTKSPPSTPKKQTPSKRNSPHKSTPLSKESTPRKESTPVKESSPVKEPKPTQETTTPRKETTSEDETEKKRVARRLFQSHSKEKELTDAKKSIEIKDKIIDSLKKELVELKTAILELEHKYESNVQQLTALIEYKDQQLKIKDKQIQELEALRERSNLDDKQKQKQKKKQKKDKNKVAPEVEEVIVNLKDDLEDSKENLHTAHKVKSFLGAEIERLRKEYEIKLSSRDRTIERLELELMQFKNNPDPTPTETAQREINALRKTLEELKWRYFSSTAIASKLAKNSEELMCNAQIQDLYEQTVMLQVDFTLYPEWIDNQLQKVTIQKTPPSQ